MPRRSSRREELIGALQSSMRRFGGEVAPVRGGGRRAVGPARDRPPVPGVSSRPVRSDDGCGTCPTLSGLRTGRARTASSSGWNDAGYVHRASDPADRRQVVIRTLPGAVGRVRGAAPPHAPRHRPVVGPLQRRRAGAHPRLRRPRPAGRAGGHRPGSAPARPASNGPRRPSSRRGRRQPTCGRRSTGWWTPRSAFPSGAGHLVIRGRPGHDRSVPRPASRPTRPPRRSSAGLKIVALVSAPLPDGRRSGGVPGPARSMLADGRALERRGRRAAWPVWSAELAGLDLRSVEIAGGGSSHVSIELPPARGVVPVRHRRRRQRPHHQPSGRDRRRACAFGVAPATCVFDGRRVSAHRS